MVVAVSLPRSQDVCFFVLTLLFCFSLLLALPKLFFVLLLFSNWLRVAFTIERLGPPSPFTKEEPQTTSKWVVAGEVNLLGGHL